MIDANINDETVPQLIQATTGDIAALLSENRQPRRTWRDQISAGIVHPSCHCFTTCFVSTS